MNGLSHWRITVYLASLFLAGAVSGWFVGTRTAKQEMFAPPRWEAISRDFSEQLQHKVNLTPDQARRAAPIIEHSSAEIKAAFDADLQKIRQMVVGRDEQIRALLTPDQKKLFEAWNKERQENWRNKEAWRAKHRETRRGSTREHAGTNNPGPTGSSTSATNRPPAHR